MIKRVLLAVLVLSLALVAAWLAAAYQPDRSVAELAPLWARAPSRFLALDGMNVHMRDEGPRDDPYPMVLLHGTSASLHTWQGWTDSLAKQRRVIRLDLPGFGLTGPFPDPASSAREADYTLTHYLQFLAHFLDALGVKRAVVAGNSFGGALAWHLAAARPDRVQALILVDAAGYKYTPSSVPIGFRLAQSPLSGLVEQLLPRAMVESSLRNVYADPSKVSSALVDRYFDLTLRAGNRHAVSQRFKQNTPGSGVASLSRLKLPTLILWGREDRLIPLENAKRFERDIQGSQLVVLDRLGHVPQEEDPMRSLAPALSFLARSSAP